MKTVGVGFANSPFTAGAVVTGQCGDTAGLVKEVLSCMFLFARGLAQPQAPEDMGCAVPAFLRTYSMHTGVLLNDGCKRAWLPFRWRALPKPGKEAAGHNV